MIGRAFLLVCALAPLCYGVTLEKCTYAHAPLPTAFRSPGCDSDRCRIPISGNLEFEIDAVVPYDSAYVFPALVIVLGQDEDGYDIQFPIALPEELGCNGLTNGCPVASNDNITFRLSIPWNTGNTNPGEVYTVRFTLYDENESTIACFKTPVEVIA